VNGRHLLAEIHSHFRVVPDRSTKDEITIVCPQPGCKDTTGNRTISLKSGLTNCWRCNVGGHFVSWAKKLGVTIVLEENEEAIAPSALEELTTSIETQPGPYIQSTPEVRLPEGFTFLSEAPDSPYTRFITKMAKRKNLSLEAFIEAGVGFTRTSPSWEPFAIFPVHEWQKTVYYQGRTYVDTPGESTKKFPSKGEVKFGASCWVYNLDEARSKRAATIIVVESILNVLSLRIELAKRGILGVVPVAVFKHSISPMQERKILTIRSVKEVCIMYDADASESAVSERRKFQNRCKFSVASIPQTESGSTQDANDNVELAVDCFLERKKFDSTLTFLEEQLMKL